MLRSSSRRVDNACAHPAIRGWTVSTASVEITVVVGITAPNNHFRTGPDCAVIVSARWRVTDASCCPSVGARTVPAPGIGIAGRANSSSSPDDHFVTGPDGRVAVSPVWRSGGVSPHPTIRTRIVSTSCIGDKEPVECAAPYNHFTARPDCRVQRSTTGCICCARRRPNISIRVVSTARIHQVHAVSASPDDHFGACPNCRVQIATHRRICRRGGCPAIGDWIISAAAVEKAAAAIPSAPDDHFATSPYCTVLRSSGRRIDGARRDPTICRRTVSETTV